MGVSIRLKRLGSNRRPFFRVVAADSQRAPQGKALEGLGHFDPLADGGKVSIDAARLAELVAQGAHVSPAVSRLVRKAAADAKA